MRICLTSGSNTRIAGTRDFKELGLEISSKIKVRNTARKKKEIIVFTGIFAIACVLQFLIIFNVKLPRYADLMESLLKSMTGYSGGA